MDPRSRGRRVLIVDDEPLFRWFASETLSERGFLVVERADAHGARAAVRGARRAFDVVVLDLLLPDSVGLSLLRSIRQLAPSARVILTTSFVSPEIERDALRLGAFKVVRKPMEMEDFAGLVAAASAGDSGPAGVFHGTAN